MKVPDYARYDYVNRKAVEFLEKYEIHSFPVNPHRIINAEKWEVEKYSELMKRFKCNLAIVARCLGSGDGYTVYNDSNFTIAYNDVSKPEGRVRFTLMHEIGHIYLGHLTDFNKTQIRRNELSRGEYRVLENEANAFARNVLIPTVILRETLKAEPTVEQLAELFGVTESAVNARLDFYQTDSSKNSQNQLNGRLRNIYINFHQAKKRDRKMITEVTFN